MIDKQRIADELEKFIEWDGEDRRFITTVSTLLFAEHIAKLVQAEAADSLEELREGLSEMQ